MKVQSTALWMPLLLVPLFWGCEQNDAYWLSGAGVVGVGDVSMFGKAALEADIDTSSISVKLNLKNAPGGLHAVRVVQGRDCKSIKKDGIDANTGLYLGDIKVGPTGGGRFDAKHADLEALTEYDGHSIVVLSNPGADAIKVIGCGTTASSGGAGPF